MKNLCTGENWFVCRKMNFARQFKVRIICTFLENQGKITITIITEKITKNMEKHCC